MKDLDIAVYQPGLNELPTLTAAGLVRGTDRVTVLDDGGAVHSGDGNVHSAGCSHLRQGQLDTTETRLDVDTLLDRVGAGRYRLCGCAQISGRLDTPHERLDPSRPQVLLTAAEMQVLYWLDASSPDRSDARRHLNLEDTVWYANSHLSRRPPAVPGRLGDVARTRHAWLSALAAKTTRDPVYRARRQLRVLDGAAAWLAMRQDPPAGYDRNREELLELTAHLDIGVSGPDVANRDRFGDDERRAVFARVCAAEVWVYVAQVPVPDRSPLSWASELALPQAPAQRGMVRIPAALAFTLNDFSWPTPVCLDDGYPVDLVRDAVRLAGPGRPVHEMVAALAAARG